MQRQAIAFRGSESEPAATLFFVVGRRRFEKDRCSTPKRQDVFDSRPCGNARPNFRVEDKRPLTRGNRPSAIAVSLYDESPTGFSSPSDVIRPTASSIARQYSESFSKIVSVKFSAFENAGRLRADRDVFQASQVGRLSVDGTEQPGQFVAFGNERLVEMFGQFARQALRLGQHLAQSHLLRRPFNHVNSSREAKPPPLHPHGAGPVKLNRPATGRREYLNRRPRIESQSPPESGGLLGR